MSLELGNIFSTKNVLLIGHPQTIDESRVAAALALHGKYKNNQIVIVTSDKNSADDIINKSENISNILLANYTDGNELALLENNLIIFDSLDRMRIINYKNELVGIKFIDLLISKRNSIIILITYGITRSVIDLFKTIAPQAVFFWTTFLEKRYNLKRVIHTTKMTPLQESIYLINRNREIEDNSKDENFMLSQRICNILLPPDLTPLIDTTDEINVEDMMEQFIKNTPIKERKTVTFKKNIIEDEDEEDVKNEIEVVIQNVRGIKTKTITTLEQQTKTFNLEIFLRDSPKIKQLISVIEKNSNSRHIIYTRYNRHYGVEMLSYLFTSLGYVVFNSEIYIPIEEQNRRISEFNNVLTPAIYITSSICNHNTEFYNISHLHILNSNYNKTNLFLGKIFKYRLYKNLPCDLTIHSYVCEGIKEKTADQFLFEQFASSEKTHLELWNLISAKGKPLFLNSENSLVYQN